MLFTRLITYDALYFKGTDAASLYDAYGDVVGGIGSYPVLGSPHYHQASDLLEFENHQLIAETSKTTIATLMLMASSPSRLTQLEWTATRLERRRYRGRRLRKAASPRTSSPTVRRRIAPPSCHRDAAARGAAAGRARDGRLGESGERARPRRLGLGHRANRGRAYFNESRRCFSRGTSG